MTVEEAWKLFHNSMVALAPATRENYRKNLKTLLEELGGMELSDVTIHDLRAWYMGQAQREKRFTDHPMRAMEAGGLSPFTLNSMVRAARRLFAWCVEEELLVISPAARLKKPRLPDAPPKAISDSDLKRLLAEAKSGRAREYAIVCFLAATGCRVGGLCSLELQNLDLERQRAVVKEKGRGGGKVRTVYFGHTCTRALRAWLEKREMYADEIEEAVFVSYTSGQALSTFGVSRALKKLAQRAGIGGRFNPHSFRHAYARKLLQNGADLATTSALMGHSGVAVTAAFYARWSDAELERRYHEFAPLD